MIIGLSGRKQVGKNLVSKIIRYLDITSTYHNITKHNWTIDQLVLGQLDEYLFTSKWQEKQLAGKLKQIVSLLTGCTLEDLENEEFKNKELGEEWYYNKVIPNYGFGSKLINWDKNLTPQKHTYRSLLQLIGTEGLRHTLHPNIFINSLFVDYDTEIWKDIIGYEGKYKVSNYGKIKSLNRISIYGESKGDYHNVKEKILKPSLSKNGYYKVVLELKQLSVHSLVANAFLDKNIFDIVNHKDGNKLNNYWKNLEWVTQKENVIHSRLSGKGNIGSKQKDSKLKDSDIIEIRELLKTTTQTQIAEKFNVSKTTICDINKGRKWAHVGRKIINVSPITLPKWIITDCRFPNECQAIKEKDGLLIRIENPRIISNDTHASEISLDSYDFDEVIINNGTIEDLVEKVKQVLIKHNIIQ